MLSVAINGSIRGQAEGGHPGWHGRGHRRGGRATPCGIGWAMGQMAGFDRARLMRRFADLIADNAKRPARMEVHDSGKTYREMIGQTW